MEHSIEILNDGGERIATRQNRRWSTAEKARIVAETLVPGATVNEVAQRYALKASRLSTWRTLARQDKLVLPAPDDAVEFAAMIVKTPAAPEAVTRSSRPEIMLGTVTIRIEEGATPERIAAIARALVAAP